MILLDGHSLTSKQLLLLSFSDEKIGIAPQILDKIKESNEFLASANLRFNIYGVNTGLGPMAQFSVSDEKLIDLQYNLIRSHNTGYPAYLGLPECKSVFISRLNSLVRGHSAVSDGLILHMIHMYNEGVVPCVPLHGGVGASGDLVQLAHVAAAVIGEGMSYFDGQIIPTSEAFSAKGIQGIRLSLREGLALINGTSAMTGVAALNISFAKTALEWTLILSVMINEVMEAFDDHFSSQLNGTKRHKGQQEIASLARKILEGSRLMRSRNSHWDKNKSEDYFKEKVQEYYSMRCIPQILGPVYDTIAFSGKVIEIVTRRKGEIVKIENKKDRVILNFDIPSRGLIGLVNPLLTATEGEAVIAHRFKDYEPWKGEIINRRNGSLIAMETGTAIAYSIDKLQDRGKFFINPGEPIYAGQIIGESTRADDLVLNVTKTKKLTNMRASGSDEKTNIAPAVKFSLEESMEYIKADEYVEVTPKSIRLRKILLDENDRKRLAKKIE